MEDISADFWCSVVHTLNVYLFIGVKSSDHAAKRPKSGKHHHCPPPTNGANHQSNGKFLEKVFLAIAIHSENPFSPCLCFASL